MGRTPGAVWSSRPTHAPAHTHARQCTHIWLSARFAKSNPFSPAQVQVVTSCAQHPARALLLFHAPWVCLSCPALLCAPVNEADRLLGTALSWFEDAVTSRPWDSTVVTAYAYHICNSIRDPTTLNDVTSPDYLQLWWVWCW